jgi:regulatory protein
MSRRKFAPSGRVPQPLDLSALNALAVGYLGKYATTQSRLRAYLTRKISERGWEGEEAAPVDAIVARCAELGYVDDAGFAAAQGAALLRRGFGELRIAQALRAVGIDAETAAPAREAARDGALEAALAFARRKRIGPFATDTADPDKRRRNLAALLRAGHSPDIARRIAYAEPGASIDAR